MKKRILSSVFVICILHIMMACNSDSEDNSVVGTWMGYSCSDSNPDDLSMNHTLTLVFNADSTGTYLEIDKTYKEQEYFNYKMDSDTRGKARTRTRGYIYFEIVSNKMYVYDHGYGNDLDFLLTKQ